MNKPEIPMPSPEEREAALFAMAARKPAGERAAFLQAVCGEESSLRQRLEALLEANDQPDDVMEPVPHVAAAKATAKLAFAEDVPDEAVGQLIGRYKVLEKVGEGGCGVVYVAEQTEPVRRRVALKVIKLGMDTKAVVARFEAERQALAMMDHPNIAKVLDAGTTERGRPYFVMELVRGIKITDYCDQEKLGTTERLDLFIRICQAIQHAHQKGIIHRDIKPSNILVTLHDGVPVPKIIDFGIAKATEGRLTDATVYTQLHQFMGTPAYMSPEQAEMSGLDIDTRSDIYSLGVLLYQLLTSKTPFDGQQLLALGLDEMRRTIREKEPLRPSTRLAALQSDELTTTAKRRSADPPKLIHLLKGDLDWIVMKCLEKDRARRYETANGLAADLKRHLDNEPVVARPRSAGYKFRKFARRNKVAFAVSAAFVLLLVVATMASTWQAFRAMRAEALVQKRILEVAAERDAKEKARKDAQAISDFITQLLESPERKGRSVTVVEILDRAVKKLDRDLAAQPARRAKMQYTLGRTYSALGLDLEAIPLFEKSRDYYRSTFGPEHPEALEGMRNLAKAYLDVGRQSEALKLQEALLVSQRKRLGPLHFETVLALDRLALYQMRCGHLDEARRRFEELLLLHRQANGPLHQKTLAAMGHLATIQLQFGNLPEALKLSQEVLELRRKALGAEHRDTLRAMNLLAAVHSKMSHTNEALALYTEVLALQRRLSGPGRDPLHKYMHTVVIAYSRFGHMEEALTLGEELLEMSRQSLGPEHRETLSAMNTLAIVYRKAGRVEEAAQLAQSSLDLHRRVTGPASEGTLNAMTELATVHQTCGRLNEAIVLEAAALRLKRKHFPLGYSALLASVENLVACYEKSDRRAEAEVLRPELSALKAKVEFKSEEQEHDATDSPEP